MKQQSGFRGSWLLFPLLLIVLALVFMPGRKQNERLSDFSSHSHCGTGIAEYVDSAIQNGFNQSMDILPTAAASSPRGVHAPR